LHAQVSNGRGETGQSAVSHLVDDEAATEGETAKDGDGLISVIWACGAATRYADERREARF
jgi:hypothetical protein